MAEDRRDKPFGKLPLYKPCPICHATLSALAIICPYCEEQLLPPDESEGCPYGEAVLLDSVMPDADGFLDMVDGLPLDAAMYMEGHGEEWKRKPPEDRRRMAWRPRER